MKSEYQKARERYEKHKNDYDGFWYDSNKEHRKETDVNNGSWVLITRTIPVIDNAKPVLYGIYWGVPNEDKAGRQTCRIRTTEDIVLLNHEYTVISEERLNEYKEIGWELDSVQNTTAEHKSLDIKMIEKGRSLCEEEREVIWALQMDGLNEEQACEEYFFSRHTDESNYTICFLPNEEVKRQIYSVFGAQR